MGPKIYKRGFDDEVLALNHRLAETTLLLEVLASVNALLPTNQKFETFCREVGQILRQRLQFTYIQIWIRDKNHPDQLRLVTDEAQRKGSWIISIHQGIVGKSIREHRTILLPDVTADSNYLNAHSEVKSELCVPLIYDGKVIGALNIETDTHQDFFNHRAIIEIIAANLSHSLKLAFLYETEEHFHNLVEHMTEGVWVVDSEERTLYTNPTLQKILGCSGEELSGKISYDFFEERSRKIVRTENEERKQGKKGHYEAVLLSKNGEHIPVLVHATPFGESGSMGTITDLRPIKKAEKKLLRAERFLASITQYCPEAIIGINEHSIIQSWNVGAEIMFGYKAAEVLGKTAEIVVPEDQIAATESGQILKEAQMKGFVRHFETVRLHKNGKPIAVSLTCSVVKDDEGKIMGFSILCRDITAQKKWERELQDRFEKMQEAYKEMGKQRRHLDYLMDMITMTSEGSHTRKQLSTFIVNAMVVITHVDAVTMRLLDHRIGRLQLVAQSGVGEEWWTKKAMSYGGSLLEMAVKKKTPLKILDILSDPMYTSPALARKNNLRSALIIPLETKGEVLGSLTLYLSHESNLSLLDDEFISIFAKQAAIGLKLASETR